MKPSVAKNLMHRMNALALALALSVASLAFAGTDFNQIPQEPLERWSGGRFIVPNEPLYSTFAVANEGKKGALISVGSFRALAAASQGDFEYAILMDADSKLVDFNREQIELLKISNSVEEFLAALVERPELAPLIKKVLRGEVNAQWELATQLSVSSSHKLYTKAEYVEALLRVSKFDEFTTFLTDPIRFARLKNLAVEGKILAIAGNLTGTETLVQIGKWLREKGTAVGVLDISNAQGYFIADKGHLEQFIANLSSLRWKRGAVVNFTAEAISRYSDEEIKNYRLEVDPYVWSYFSLEHNRFVREMKEIVNSSSPFGNYIRIIHELKHTRADLHHQAYLQRKSRPLKCEAIFVNKAH